MRGFSFVITFVINLKIIKDETKYSTFYLNLKVETTIHITGIYSIFESIYSMIVTKIRKCQVEGLG